MQTELKIEGMSCSHCVRSVREALESVPGVENATVNLEAGTALVEHGDPIDAGLLASAVQEEGYRVREA